MNQNTDRLQNLKRHHDIFKEELMELENAFLLIKDHYSPTIS